MGEKISEIQKYSITVKKFLTRDHEVSWDFLPGIKSVCPWNTSCHGHCVWEGTDTRRQLHE
ncbi:hypothetical protein PRBEI_2000238000 [Prionailurus iriomotensis]